jgi:hypothetical protein
VPGVADHRGRPAQERELGDPGQHQDVGVGLAVEDAPGVGEYRLQPLPALPDGCRALGEETRPQVGVGGAEGDQDGGPVLVEPLPGEGGGRAPGERRADVPQLRQLRARAREFGGGEGEHQVGGEARIVGAPRVAEAGAQLRDEPGGPLRHLRHAVQGIAEFRRGGRRGGVRHPEALGDQGAGEGLLVGDDDIGPELLDRAAHTGRHRPGKWHEELLPQEAQGGGPT